MAFQRRSVAQRHPGGSCGIGGQRLRRDVLGLDPAPILFRFRQGGVLQKKVEITAGVQLTGSGRAHERQGGCRRVGPFGIAGKELVFPTQSQGPNVIFDNLGQCHLPTTGFSLGGLRPSLNDPHKETTCVGQTQHHAKLRVLLFQAFIACKAVRLTITPIVAQDLPGHIGGSGWKIPKIDHRFLRISSPKHLHGGFGPVGSSRLIENLERRFIHLNLGTGKKSRLQWGHDRIELLGNLNEPAHHGGPRKIDAHAGKDFFLELKGRDIAELCDDDGHTNFSVTSSPILVKGAPQAHTFSSSGRS